MLKPKWNVLRLMTYGFAIGAVLALFQTLMEQGKAMNFSNPEVIANLVGTAIGGAVGGALIIGAIALVRNLFARS